MIIDRTQATVLSLDSPGPSVKTTFTAEHYCAFWARDGQPGLRAGGSPGVNGLRSRGDEAAEGEAGPLAPATGPDARPGPVLCRYSRSGISCGLAPTDS